MRTRVFVVAVLAAVTLMAVAAAPASAIIDGRKDTANVYSNVGMFAVEVADGVWGHGTCTLVGDGMVLTAAHNLDLVTDLAQVRVSFASNATDLDPSGDGFYGIKSFDIIDGYASDSLAGIKDDSKRFLRRNDLAVVRLTEVPEIEPAKVIGTENWLNTIDLRSASFTVVGYGTTGFVAGSALSWNNPNTEMPYDGRRSKAVRAINNSEVYADRYLKTTTGTSFGDSGGPLFFGRTLVGGTVWGESMRCESPAYEFRLDCPAAQEFLHEYLPEGCFATPE
jgi:hypothetical protein